MYALLRQTYRHLVQQAIVRQEIRLMRRTHAQASAWEAAGISALFSAAAVCGTLAQTHLS